MGRFERRRAGSGRCAIALAVLCAGLWSAPDRALADDDLLDLSLEELMNVEVTSVSKKAESKNDTAASIHVITAEDIRRGGFRSVPEALRVVPGVQVARIDASRWAISIRGFREEFSNKLLVLIDGRPVYTPLFGGVVWGEQNLAIEDVARIEVIRGPGGAIWGANAVNGVINVITRHTRETQGGLVAVQGGTQQYGATARYGARLGEGTTARLTARWDKVEDFDDEKNYDANDEWANLRIGVRADHDVDERSSLSFHLDYFDVDTTTGSAILGPFPFFPVLGFEEDHTRGRGGSAMLKYERDLGEASSFSFQSVYDLVDRRTVLDERSHNFQVSTQVNTSLTEGLSLVSGVDYRYWTTHVDSIGPLVGLEPNDDDFHLGSGFVQLELDLFGDVLKLIAGTKLSVNSWSGFEYQPSGRFVIAPAEGHTIWGAVSRAVRTPTSINNDLTTVIGPVTLLGDRDFASEELLSYELGYRFYSLEKITAEISAFYSDYDDVSSLVGPAPFGPLVFANPGSLRLIGGEAEVTLLPVDWWRLTLGYSLIKFLEEEDITSVIGPATQNRSHPRHQVVVRSVLDLPADLELDASVYWVDGLGGLVPEPASLNDNVNGYVRLDLRLGWKPADWLEIALVGQNLTDKRHYEFIDVQRNQTSQIPRAGYALVTIDFD